MPSKNTISVNQAILRGQFVVNLPVLLLLTGIPFSTWFLFKRDFLPGFSIGIAILAGVILAWLYWSYSITKWRIWAFSNVRNVHDLQIKAVRAQLIWPEGNFFEKTEIRSASDKAKLLELQRKFEHNDEFEENRSLPQTLSIRFSRQHQYIEIGGAILALAAAVSIMIPPTTKSVILGAAVVLLVVFPVAKSLRRLRDREPVIILNAIGIQTRESGFTSWENISGEQVEQTGSGKSIVRHLVFYDADDDYVSIDLETLDIGHNQLEDALRTYRIRHSKQKSSTYSYRI